MHEFLVSAAAFIVLVGAIIVVHEGGHFIVAKLCRVRVEAFSIGFGPRLSRISVTPAPRWPARGSGPSDRSGCPRRRTWARRGYLVEYFLADVVLDQGDGHQGCRAQSDGQHQ